MTTHEQMRRLEVLEAVAHAAAIDHELEAMRPRIVEIADELGMTPDAFMDEVRRGMRRSAAIGEAAYEAELAAELGCTVDELRAEAVEWAERDRLHAERRQEMYL